MMNEDPLYYFDHNATTPVAPEVVEAMLPFFRERWGNPSSAYGFGHFLSRDIDEARAEVARLINAEPREIVFTSCGTESNNAALHSALATQPDKRHILISAVEHSATMKYCAYLRQQGCEVTMIGVDNSGALDLQQLTDAIRSDTAIVSMMWANNETGVIFPISEIAAICRHKAVQFHTDAVQAAGKVPVDVKAAGVNYLSLSGHKINAPKGIGVLYVSRQTKFEPFIFGGGQERGRRGGTENVPYIIGLGRAAQLARERLKEQSTRVRELRDKLESGILSRVKGSARNGGPEPRLPNTANIAFEGVEAEGVLLLLDQEGICASSGSACTTGSLEPSHVLAAMGLTRERARSSVRFSLGYHTEASDVERVLEVLPGAVFKLRALALQPGRPEVSAATAR